MSKKYESLAAEIIRFAGGSENIDSVHHCQTRLRFKLIDDSRADTDSIMKLDKVVQVINKGGMYQVVIGMDVADVYDEVEKLLPGDNAGQDTKKTQDDAEKPAEKKNIFGIVTDFISSIFSPIVPALAGAGMIKALLALLIAFNWISKDSQTYIILELIGDATFAFMPILLAFTTAQKLKCNPILAAVTAGIICHASWTSLVTAGTPIYFAGFIPLYLVKYTGSVIPIVLIVLAQAPLEKFLNRVVPNAIRLVVVPMIVFLVMGVLAFSVLGPLGDYIGTIFTMAFSWLSTNVGWLEAGLMGGLYSTLVIFGLHHGLAPLGTMQMAQMGYDGIFGPGVLCANIGQGTSALVTGKLSKDSKMKQIATSAGITGLMGTTEPALYGVNLPEKYPLIAGAIGAACGGFYAGFTHTHRFATGSSGLPAVVMYIGDDTLTNFYNILISLGITIVVSAVMTVVLKKRFEVRAKAAEKKQADQVTAEDPILAENAGAADAVSSEIVASPVKGKAYPISEARDEVFASGVMGQGTVIEPADGKVTAPFDCEVEAAFPTGHAFGLKSASKAELLIHVGIDTVELNGRGFTPKVKQGDHVRKGDTLVEFDIPKIEKAGYSTQTMVLVTNSGDYKSVELKADGPVNFGDALLALEV